MTTGDAFTLVELVVVIAIILLLAALLLPSLKRARYEAHLTLCVSNIRQTVLALTSYAMDNDGSLPYRHVLQLNDVEVRAEFVRFGTADERPQTAPYFRFRTLSCPLAPPGFVNIDTATATGGTWAPYLMTHGWAIDPAQPASNMRRIDDAHVYSGNRFSTLVADGEVSRNGWAGASQTYGSHPYPGAALARRSDATYAYVIWGIPGTFLREAMDRNFGRTDGSVVKLRNLVMDDPRLVRLPGLPRDTAAPFYFYLPAD